jgi:hypothetical protein
MTLNVQLQEINSFDRAVAAKAIQSDFVNTLSSQFSPVGRDVVHPSVVPVFTAKSI